MSGSRLEESVRRDDLTFGDGEDDRVGVIEGNSDASREACDDTVVAPRLPPYQNIGHWCQVESRHRWNGCTVVDLNTVDKAL